MAIDSACDPFCWWTRDEFLQALRDIKTIGCVAEIDREIVGFMIYELHGKYLHVINFAVDPGQQRAGVGTAMVDRLKAKLSQQKRDSLTVAIREHNLNGQLFFQSCGFLWEATSEGFYSGEDAYHMRYGIGNE
jgi:ribosomal-protein-alanine N-acetyltransferase